MIGANSVSVRYPRRGTNQASESTQKAIPAAASAGARSPLHQSAAQAPASTTRREVSIGTAQRAASKTPPTPANEIAIQNPAAAVWWSGSSAALWSSTSVAPTATRNCAKPYPASEGGTSGSYTSTDSRSTSCGTTRPASDSGRHPGGPKTYIHRSRQLLARHTSRAISQKTCTFAHSGFQLRSGFVIP